MKGSSCCWCSIAPPSPLSAPAGGSTLGSASGGSVFVHALAEALAALPRLSDERDREQVEGISRLARVLQVRTRGWVC